MPRPIPATALNKGFTLLELLVAIAIIGVLALVVLIGTGESRTKGKIAATELSLRNIQNALEVYRTTFNEYPPIGSDFCNICVYWGPGNPTWDAIPNGGPGKYNSIQYATGTWSDDILTELEFHNLLTDGAGTQRDPWGNEYLYDKNQIYSCYTWSPICSTGPNEVLETPHCPNRNTVPRAGGDDICVFLQP